MAVSGLRQQRTGERLSCIQNRHSRSNRKPASALQRMPLACFKPRLTNHTQSQGCCKGAGRLPPARHTARPSAGAASSGRPAEARGCPRRSGSTSAFP
eukprot:4155032-Alexandrium_andersonii.AAC.1